MVNRVLAPSLPFRDARLAVKSGPESPPAPMFLTAAEVGRELGVGRSRVYELAAAGHLPVVRLGRRMWFPRRGLDALAETAIRRAEEALPQSS